MQSLRFKEKEEKLPNAKSIAALAVAGALVGWHMYNLWWKVAGTIEKRNPSSVREFDEPSRPMLPPEKRQIRT